MDNKQLSLFQGDTSITIPKSAITVEEIVPLAGALNSQQQKNIMQAFALEAYEMGAEFVWKRAMVKLRNILKSMGMTFIGEMLERPDIDEWSSIEQVLTDFETIDLAKRLSVVSPKGAMKLNHCLDLLIHYFDDDVPQHVQDEDELNMDHTEGIDIVKTCIRYILGKEQITAPIEFSQFRYRILTETLPQRDPVIDTFETAPLFQVSTVLSILLNAIKESKSPESEHAIDNLNLFIVRIWERIGEKEKYRVGEAFRDVASAGNKKMSKGLRIALSKVNGFDYVPENLRSITFRRAAQEVIKVHFAYQNFYNEPGPTRALSELGSKIPDAAFPDCIRAYLCVYLGNFYNVCREAAEIAEDQLTRIPEQRWLYYFEKVFLNDEIILRKLTVDKSRTRWRAFMSQIGLDKAHFNNNAYLNSIFQASMKAGYSKLNDIIEKHMEHLHKERSR